MCRSYSQFLVYVYVLDYPTINSLCYSVILIPWFLMNYEGRLLQQITDRMVSYNSLSCLCYWISAQVFHNILSLCGHKRRASSPPRHSYTTNPCRAFVVLSMSSLLHLHLWLLPGVCKTEGPGCNQKT